MTVRIENIIHYTNFRKDGRRIPMLEVHYVTTKGFEGVVHVEETGATKASVTAAVLEAAALPDEMIGAKLTEKP